MEIRQWIERIGSRIKLNEQKEAETRNSQKLTEAKDSASRANSQKELSGSKKINSQALNKTDSQALNPMDPNYVQDFIKRMQEHSDQFSKNWPGADFAEGQLNEQANVLKKIVSDRIASNPKTAPVLQDFISRLDQTDSYTLVDQVLNDEVRMGHRGILKDPQIVKDNIELIRHPAIEELKSLDQKHDLGLGNIESKVLPHIKVKEDKTRDQDLDKDMDQTRDSGIDLA